MCHRYNEKADVFSFGVALYEVLSRTMLNMTKRGARPGEGETPLVDGEVMTQLQRKQWLKCTHWPLTVPPPSTH